MPIKYRRKVITDAIGSSLKSICMEIDYEEDHVLFLLQSVPTYSVSAIVTKLKSLTARELFLKHPEIKKELWGGIFLDKRVLHKHSKIIW